MTPDKIIMAYEAFKTNKITLIDLLNKLEQYSKSQHDGKPLVMRGQSPEPLALIEQELNRLTVAKAATKHFDDAVTMGHKIADCQNAIQLIKELQAKANGA